MKARFSFSLMLVLIGVFIAEFSFAIVESSVPPAEKIDQIEAAAITGDDVNPGLQTTYYDDFFKRDLQFLPKAGEKAKTSRDGGIVTELNHQFGKKQIYKSGRSQGVGVRFNGFLHLQDPGKYRFQFLSNDGAALYFNNQLLVADSKQHSDRLSAIGEISVQEAGYYPITVEYFQRKGTASLILYWAKGESGFQPIPATAYFHKKESLIMEGDEVEDITCD